MIISASSITLTGRETMLEYNECSDDPPTHILNDNSEDTCFINDFGSHLFLLNRTQDPAAATQNKMATTLQVRTRQMDCRRKFHVMVFVRGVLCRDNVDCGLVDDGSLENDAGLCHFTCDCSSGENCRKDGMIYLQVASVGEGELCEVNFL